MDLSARRYDPMTALFTSVDELWATFPQQHGYHYAYHDPVNYGDPSGYCVGCTSQAPSPGPGEAAGPGQGVGVPNQSASPGLWRRSSDNADEDLHDYLFQVLWNRLRDTEAADHLVELAMISRSYVESRVAPLMPDIKQASAMFDPEVRRLYRADDANEMGFVLVESNGVMGVNSERGDSPVLFNPRILQPATIGGIVRAIMHTHVREGGLLPPSLQDVLYVATGATQHFERVNDNFMGFVQVGSERYVTIVTNVPAARALSRSLAGANESLFPRYIDLNPQDTQALRHMLTLHLAALNRLNLGVITLRMVDPVNHVFEMLW